MRPWHEKGNQEGDKIGKVEADGHAAPYKVLHMAVKDIDPLGHEAHGEGNGQIHQHGCYSFS